MENGIEYEIVEHAKTQLKIRKIALEEIVACLKNPGQVVPEKKGRLAYQGKLPSNGKIYIVRVIVEKKAERLRVITAYKTGKVDKYWKEG